MTRLFARVLPVLLCLLAAALAWGDEPDAAQPAPARYTIRTDRSGVQINWLVGQLEVVGIGYARNKSTLAMRQAINTAQVIMNREARRALKGVRVDGATLLGDVVKDAETERLLDGVLDNLRVVDERWVTPGTYAVVGIIPFYGEQGITYLGAKNISTKKALELQARDMTMALEVPRGHTPQRADGPYTGVIINADHLVLTPCLFPRVIRFDGKELWGMAQPAPASPVAVINGPARYALNVEDALARKLAGANPLILEAVGVGQGCYPILNLDDVYLVLHEHKFHSLLNNLPIIITMGNHT
jgi:hypothetical protein